VQALANRESPLVNSLRHPRREVRNRAALALGKFGHNARSAIPALISLLDDPDIFVRLAATKALRQIDRRVLEKSIGP
jgi:HEAT repeat protein